jgi:hypothetical protein
VNSNAYNELWEYRGNPAKGGDSVETTRERPATGGDEDIVQAPMKIGDTLNKVSLAEAGDGSPPF